MEITSRVLLIGENVVEGDEGLIDKNPNGETNPTSLSPSKYLCPLSLNMNRTRRPSDAHISLALLIKARGE